VTPDAEAAQVIRPSGRIADDYGYRTAGCEAIALPTKVGRVTNGSCAIMKIAVVVRQHRYRILG
jgi:hypothetical protein